MIKFEQLPADILARIPAVTDALQSDENVLFAYLFGSLASSQPVTMASTKDSSC